MMEFSFGILSETSSISYHWSHSPEFDPDAETDQAPVNSDDSAETVTVEVTKTPPMRLLRSASNKMPTHNTNAVNAQKKEDTSKKRKNKNAAQPAREAKCRHKSKLKSVSFTLPVQRSIRRDNADEQCRTLNIIYKWWEGMKDEKEQYHKSQMAFYSKSKIPKDQDVPGNCLLCPLKKYIKDNWDLKRHYNAVHIANLIVIDQTVALQCKCSDVRSCGWDRDKSTRNSHYHCTVCHWPRDRIPQLVNHMITQHNIDVGLIRHLNKKSKLFTIYVPFICMQSTTVMLYSELMWSLIVMC